MDSLGDEAPAFGKPEEIPLVVPEIPSYLCTAKNKKGEPCGFTHRTGSAFCTVHDPTITDEQRDEWRRNKKGKKYVTQKTKAKSRQELLEILSGRLDMFLENHGHTSSVEVEMTICDMARTYIAVLRADVEGDAKVRGWRMKGAS